VANGPYHWPVDPAFVGGQGEIRFGTNASGDAVALKLASASKSAKEALRREIDVLTALEKADVPNVVRVLDQVDHGGRPGMVMHKFTGTLRDWIDVILAEPTTDTLALVLVRCRTLATALGGVHKVKLADGGALVHRDIKPENVLMDEHGEVYLADFGGALAVDGLAAVEMGLFGTPMWAPFDQILPGLAIPDPTWDTYALCVILYACLTGARPAYQADPRELLSEQGLKLWDVAKLAIHADGDHQRTLRAEFTLERQGTSAEDLVSMTGRSALNDADRRVLMEGIDRLAALAHVPNDQIQRLKRGIWGVLVRGLSPLSHPSPPNRYRDATELADALDDLYRLAFDNGPTTDILSGPAPAPDVFINASEPPKNTDSGTPLLIFGLVVIGAVALLIGGASLLTRLSKSASTVPIPAITVTLDGLDVRVAPFLLDRDEVTREAWMLCVDATFCSVPTITGNPKDPVAGLTFDAAVAYCAFMSARLPSEVEWHAAAGSDLYPWGSDSPTCDHATAAGCSDLPLPPGSARLGATTDGVNDMAGNVWEWARVGKGGDRGVLLGGSVHSPASELGRRARLLPSRDALPELAGVRCAYDAVD
jgi:serine/threonine protein kinase